MVNNAIQNILILFFCIQLPVLIEWIILDLIIKYIIIVLNKLILIYYDILLINLKLFMFWPFTVENYIIPPPNLRKRKSVSSPIAQSLGSALLIVYYSCTFELNKWNRFDKIEGWFNCTSFYSLNGNNCEQNIYRVTKWQQIERDMHWIQRFKL